MNMFVQLLACFSVPSFQVEKKENKSFDFEQ